MREIYPGVSYIVTVATWGHADLLPSDKHKAVILQRILGAAARFCPLDFAIMSDHYHLWFDSDHTAHIPDVVRWISGGGTFALHQQGLCRGRVFETSHLTYVKQAFGSDRARGYVVGNPFKHQEVSSIHNLKRYPFSSFGIICKQEGIIQAKELVFSSVSFEDDQLGIPEAG